MARACPWLYFVIVNKLTIIDFNPINMKNKFNELLDYIYANAPQIIDQYSRVILNILTLMIISLIIRNIFFSTL